MKKIPGRSILLTAVLLSVLQGSVVSQTRGYRSPETVEKWIREVVDSHPGIISSSVLTTTPGNRPVYLLEIGNEIGESDKAHPSVFVGSNLEGNRPLATEAAIYLAEQILNDPSNYDTVNWYIIPVGNPDAAMHYFQDPLCGDARNDLPSNDDRDEQTDEDGPDDLNRDGLITRMRVKHPDGEWIPSEDDPRLMRKADPRKGEKGMYRIYSEGIDNDGDGLYNEDGKGGTNVNMNFPFLFQNFTEAGGLYPGSTPESYAVMEFVFSHPDIAMIFSFGATNFCLNPPEGGRKGEADLNRIRVPERQARMFNLDASRTYTMDELVALVRAEYPGEQFDESDIAGFLNLGPAVNPQEEDLVFYKKYSQDYREYLKERGETGDRFGPDAAREGSMELWGYFHVGVPVFSMDLWGVPMIPADTSRAGASRAPDKGREGAEADVANREIALLSFSDSLLNGKGFIDWQSFDHPSLGEVEIGGFAPYSFSTPPYHMVDSILARKVPWVLKLAGELPDLRIFDIRITETGSGVFELEVWVENNSYIPFPTAMGKRNRQPAPAVLVLGGDQVELLSGYRRTPVRNVPAMSRVKMKWILHTDDPAEIVLKLESKTAGGDQHSVKIGG